MNPGPAEEGAKIATGIVDALRSQPLMLVLLLFNALVFVVVFWSVRDTRAHEFELRKLNLTMLDNSQKLLANCVSAEMLKHLDKREP